MSKAKPDFQYLSQIFFDISELVQKHEETIGWLNDWNYQAVLRQDRLQEAIEGIDVYDLSSFWYRKFSGGMMGILTAWPWDALLYNDRYKHNGSKLGDEEDIWAVLLEYHYFVKDWTTVRFRYNKKSPLDKWLRRYANADTSGWNVTTNVETVMRVAIKYLFEHKTETFFDIEETPQEEEEEEDELFSD